MNEMNLKEKLYSQVERLEAMSNRQDLSISDLMLIENQKTKIYEQIRGLEDSEERNEIEQLRIKLSHADNELKCQSQAEIEKKKSKTSMWGVLGAAGITATIGGVFKLASEKNNRKWMSEEYEKSRLFETRDSITSPTGKELFKMKPWKL